MAIQTRAIRTRKRAINSFARLIAERGYSRTAVTDIVDVPGLTKGSLYHHFPSKDAAAEALLDVAAEKYEFLEAYSPSFDSRPQSALALLADYTDRAHADVVLQAESVLWSDPDFIDRARAGLGYVSLRDRLAELTTPQLADALMMIILGISATPGLSHGLATSDGGIRLKTLAAAVLAGLGHSTSSEEPTEIETQVRRDRA